MAKILLVDDDAELTELLAQLLDLEGFQVNVANNGKDALELLDHSYDLILLDIMMPVLNGIETLKQIRKNYSTPVMMLTARGDDIDRILGLELGADDYLPKPFNDRELVARIKAILRRTAQANNAKDPTDVDKIEFGGIVFYPGRQQAMLGSKDLELTGTEFALLLKLITHPGLILTREELSLEVLGKPLTPFDRAIDMHMSNLRKKLPARSDDLPWFKTLRGRGYLLIAEK
ncbi:response regulator [Aggregatibacter actinomycetemcomitans]|uniref:response regulator n=1 Tax=Aggregatibacter actinomycetemcomitans TaxID=714 RepID=UPI0011D78EB9|nr:response regulator [Aggregatibacter actinomycetemcomitans]TYA23009.1 response regulator [Aggregatibacter actinomycetemcomitans]